MYVGFDYHNDKGIKSFLAGQAKLPTSPFWGADWSMKEAAPEADWEIQAERRIKQCDIVLIMLGKQTHKASGVLKEVALARKHNKHVVQIIAYSDLVNPIAVPDAGKVYRWSWSNLEALLS